MKILSMWKGEEEIQVREEGIKRSKAGVAEEFVQNSSPLYTFRASGLRLVSEHTRRMRLKM